MSNQKEIYRKKKTIWERELDVLEFYAEESDKVLDKICMRKKANDQHLKNKNYCKQNSNHFMSHVVESSVSGYIHDDDFLENHPDENQQKIPKRQHKKKPSKHKTIEIKTIVCHNISFKKIRCS